MHCGSDGGYGGCRSGLFYSSDWFCAAIDVVDAEFNSVLYSQFRNGVVGEDRSGWFGWRLVAV